MAAVTIPHTFANGVASSATQVNANFSALVTFLNNNVLHADGATVPTADLGLGGNKVENIAAGTAGSDAVQKAYVDTFRDAGLWTGPSQAINTSNAKTWDTEVADPLGWANLGADNTLFTCPETGLYMIMYEYYGINTAGEFMTWRLDNYTQPAQYFTNWVDSSSGSNYNYRQYFSIRHITATQEVKFWGSSSTQTVYGPRCAILKLAD